MGVRGLGRGRIIQVYLKRRGEYEGGQTLYIHRSDIPDVSDTPKVRALEAQRKTRLLHLYDWGKARIPEDVLFETMAQHMLTNQAQAEFGVGYHTALDYSRVVLARLKLEKKRDLVA